MIELTEVYPFNLACDIFENEEDAREIYVPGIALALATLTEREADVLRKRYYDKMTLKAIGDTQGVGSERIRQIEAKALRKLRNPSRKRTMTAVSLVGVVEDNARYSKLQRDYDLLLNAFAVITDKKADQASVEQVIETALTDQTSVEDLDLSVRSTNCLRRAGHDTVGKIAKLTESDLRKVRNLGRRSVEEIIDCMKKHGYEIARCEG